MATCVLPSHQELGTKLLPLLLNVVVTPVPRVERTAQLLKTGQGEDLPGIDRHRYVLEATRGAIAAPGTVTIPEDLP